MRTFSALTVALALLACACRTTPTAQVAEYGQAGPGKIVIVIAGGVERPGRYYVEEGATLWSISELFGGFRACETCGFAPSRIIVFRKGPEETCRYSLSRTNEWRQIPLRDGDRVSYATIHF